MSYKIDENYTIDIDRYQFILKKKRVAKSGKSEGEVFYDDIGYYGNLANLLKKYFHLNLQNNENQNLSSLNSRLNELETKINEIGKDVNVKLWKKFMN
ncbi:hypothetical protein [Paraliobacillus ryukyuensis]|uniref:hypothetical protein n=1 Tax=Paraliobacillus ryukyuensis TaxID=200904 RepID=UPI0009A7FAEF|nr:hypothetical protein [Paraliobacillus ryukyuensis]